MGLMQSIGLIGGISPIHRWGFRSASRLGSVFAQANLFLYDMAEAVHKLANGLTRIDFVNGRPPRRLPTVIASRAAATKQSRKQNPPWIASALRASQ